MTIIVKYGLLAFPFASIGLGVWQIRRLEWKKGLIANLDRQLLQDPIDISQLDLAQDLDKLEYRRIKARGKYDPNPSHQLYLSPRSLIVNEEAILRGRTAHQSSIGVNVITPFRVDNSDLKILVNRGWLAKRGRDNIEDSAHIGLGNGKDSIELVGVLRKSDRAPKYGMTNNETLKEWQIRDVEAMARVLNTAPVLLDADVDKNRTSGPYGGQTQLNVRNEHLNYAITWFGLALCTLLMWYSKYGKKNLFGNKTRAPKLSR